MRLVFVLSSLQSSKDDDQLDCHSPLETGVHLTVIIHYLTSPSNAGKSVAFLVQCSGCLKQARSVQIECATAAEAYLWPSLLSQWLIARSQVSCISQGRFSVAVKRIVDQRSTESHVRIQEIYCGVYLQYPYVGRFSRIWRTVGACTCSRYRAFSLLPLKGLGTRLRLYFYRLPERTKYSRNN